MPKIDDFGRPIDTSVVAIARAIRTVETQNNYNAKGKSGESGAYQWMPGNYEAASKKYFGEVLPKDPVNQDKVAYYQLLDLKNKGYTPEQVASAWNSGSPDFKGKVGTNKFGVKYDVPGYVNKVTSEYLKQKETDLSLQLPHNGGLRLANTAYAAGPDVAEPGVPQLDDVEKKLGGTGLPTQPEKPFTISDVLGNFSKGVAKGELSTLKGLGTVGQFILDQSAGRVVNAAQGKGFTPTGPTPGDAGNIYRFGTDEERKAAELLTPKGAAENVGFYGEKTLEFLIPAAKVAKAEAGIDAMITGTGFLSGAGRVAAKAGIEAAAGGGVTLAQTGSPTEALKGAAFFGGTKAVLGTAGELARGFNLPERIYSSIFKNTYQDVRSELTSEGLKAFQKNDPVGFKNLVSAGIIKVPKSGVITVNETLAKEALDKGLKGSLKNMSNQVVKGLYESEAKVRQIASRSRVKVDVSEKQFSTVLQHIAEDYGDVGFGQFAQKAKALSSAIKASKGKVSANTALEIRRLLDGLRTRSSYGAVSPRLSLSQQNLKFLSNTLRTRVNGIKGMGDVMKDYSFYIDALEHLGKAAQRAGNNQIISLLDGVFFSGAAIGNPAIGAGLGVGRRLLTVPSSATRLGSAIQNSGNLTKTGAAVRGAATSLLRAPAGQSQ